LETVISFKNVCFYYPEEEKPVISGLNLSIGQGEFLSIKGDSSSGKSTLALILSQIIPEKYSGVFSGEVKVNGTIGILFQQTDNQLFSLTVFDDIAFSLRCQDVQEEQVLKKVHSVAKLLGIELLLTRSSSTLSSGQKQKVALASIIISNPDILILDEPASNIDPVSIVTIQEVINQINKNGSTVIILEKTNSQYSFGKRALKLQDGQLSEKFVITDNKEFQPDLRKASTFIADNNTHNQSVIKIDNLTFGFQEQQEIFSNLNLELFAGNVYMIIGHNGSGKTTFAKLLIKSLKPKSGIIHRFISHKKNLNIGYTFQNPNYQLFESTVYREIAFGLKGLKLKDNEIKQKVNYYLDLLQIGHLQEVDPHSLSIGQKRIVTVASILVMEPAVIILDEPTCGLDRTLSDILLKGIQELRKSGKAIVILTHDINYFANISDSILALKDKTLIPIEKNELFENTEEIYSIPKEKNIKLNIKRNKASFKMPLIVKIVLLIAFTFLVFTANDKLAIITFLISSITLFVFFKRVIIKSKEIPAFKRMVRFLLVLPIFTFVFFWISEKDLVIAGFMTFGAISKIGILIYLVILFTFSTSEYEIIKTVKSFKLSPKYAFMFSLSVRSLPLLFKDLNAILEIQRCRARRNNLSSFFALALPTFLTLIIRSIEISLSMHTKGFSLLSKSKEKEK